MVTRGKIAPNLQSVLTVPKTTIAPTLINVTMTNIATTAKETTDPLTGNVRCTRKKKRS